MLSNIIFIAKLLEKLALLCITIAQKIKLSKAKDVIENTEKLPPKEAVKNANDLFRKL